MKAAIFYGSQFKLSNAHKPVHNPHQPPRGQKQPPYYIRMKVVNCDAVKALDIAKPMDDETVLNTVDLF